MNESSQQAKENSAPGKDALKNFLSRLAPDTDEAAQEYLRLQFKIEKFFEFNGMDFADEHAAVVLDRAVKRLSKKAGVANVRAFTYGIARKVLLELLKKRNRQRKALAEMLKRLRDSPDTHLVEAQHECLERCLAEYPDAKGQIILRCFKAPWGGRRELAEELNTTPQDLAQLIFKAKPELRACIEKCLSRNLLR